MIKKMDESNNIGQMLCLPYEIERPNPKSDALDDVHIRFNHWVNFIGDVLLASHSSKSISELPHNEVIQLYNQKNKSKIFPDITIQPKESRNLSKSIYQGLFYSSIVQLSTIYEIFLSELIGDILWHNGDWLETDERQLSAKEIFKIGSIELIKTKLVDDRVLAYAMMSYPKKVEKFQKDFHVGLHQKGFPLSLFEVHDFLEVRNVIVHSDGYASGQYFERMKNYDNCSLLSSKQRTPQVDFSWLLNFGKQLMSLCVSIDIKVGDKWKTTRNI